MVQVRISLGGNTRDISESEEAESQYLAEKMFSKGKSYAHYSQYASSQNVKDRLRYFWNKQGQSNVF